MEKVVADKIIGIPSRLVVPNTVPTLIKHFDFFNNEKYKNSKSAEFTFDKYNVKKLAYFPPGIEYYERYWIFEITNP